MRWVTIVTVAAVGAAAHRASADVNLPNVGDVKAYVNAYIAGQFADACNRLTTDAKNSVFVLASAKVSLPSVGLSAQQKCELALGKLHLSLSSAQKTAITDAMTKVKFTALPSPTLITLKPANIDRTTVKAVQLAPDASKWGVHSGFQGGWGAPSMIPVPEVYACLTNDTAQSLLCKLKDVGGGGSADPSCSGPLDIGSLAPAKLKDLLAKVDKAIPCLCSGMPDVKNASLTRPIDDIDGDGLSNLVELTLMKAGKKTLDVCDADTDNDKIPDALDLVPGSKSGIRVDVKIARIEQEYDSPLGKKIMDDGPANGLGDPWVPGAVISTGSLKEGHVQFNGLTWGKDKHPNDPPNVVTKWKGQAFTLKGGAVTISADVSKYSDKLDNRFWKRPANAAPGLPVAKVPSGLPSVALSVLFLDWDSDWKGSDKGCDNEVYMNGEPEVKACGERQDLVPKYDGFSLAWELFGAPGSVAELANQAVASGKNALKHPTCIDGWAMRVCFEVTVSDDKGKPLDPCALALGTAAWKTTVVDKLPILKELPTDVLAMCKAK